MKITKRQLRRIIKEEADSVMVGHVQAIEKMFLKDVIEFVRRDIVPESAPALAGMPLHVFLQKAADLAKSENPNELVSGE